MIREAKGQGVFRMGLCDDDVAFLLKNGSHPDLVRYHHFGFIISSLAIVDEFKDIVLAGHAHASWDGKTVDGEPVEFNQTISFEDDVPDEIWDPTIVRLLYWSQQKTPLSLVITNTVTYLYDEYRAAVVFPGSSHPEL